MTMWSILTRPLPMTLDHNHKIQLLYPWDKISKTFQFWRHEPAGRKDKLKQYSKQESVYMVQWKNKQWSHSLSRILAKAQPQQDALITPILIALSAVWSQQQENIYTQALSFELIAELEWWVRVMQTSPSWFFSPIFVYLQVDFVILPNGKVWEEIRDYKC